MFCPSDIYEHKNFWININSILMNNGVLILQKFPHQTRAFFNKYKTLVGFTMLTQKKVKR
jgi:hypothetical protein